MEDEKVFNRYDRLAINAAFGDPARRDRVIRALQDVELSSNPRFEIQKLKMLIHQNEAGLPSREAVLSSSSAAAMAAVAASSAVPQYGAPANQLHMQFRQVAQHPTLLSIHEQPVPLRLPLSVAVAAASSSSTSSTAPASARQPYQQQQQPTTPTTSSAKPFASFQRDDDPTRPAPPPQPSQYSPERPSGTDAKNKSGTKPSPADQTKQSSDRKAARLNDGNNSVGNDSRMIHDTHTTITNVIGEAPVYSENYGVCVKIGRRLQEFIDTYADDPSKLLSKKFAVIVGQGSCNPLTRMHMRSYFLAKQYLEGRGGFTVLGSIISPAHGATVRERYRNNRSEIIPSPHRLAVAQLMVQSSKWISVDPWEITRRRAMDYLALLEHVCDMLTEHFPGVDVKVFYLCKTNLVPLISPQALRDGNFGVVSVCRPLECERLLVSLGAKWNGLIWVAEDTAILDASMDVVTSRKVRTHVRESKSVKHWMGDLIEEYFRQHRVGAKMNGEELWEHRERHLPHVPARPVLPPMAKNSEQLKMLTRSANGSVGGTDALPHPSRRLLPSLNDDTATVMSELTTASNQRGRMPTKPARFANLRQSADPYLPPPRRGNVR